MISGLLTTHHNMASNRGRKEQSPPPLLLMPAGEGLTMSTSSMPSLLMPLTQPEQSLIPSDEEAEADSFVGQSSGAATGANAFSLFSQVPSSASDPFSQIGQPSISQMAPPTHSSFTPIDRPSPMNTPQMPVSAPPPNSSTAPPFGVAPVASVAPMMASPPKGQSSNLHRLQGPMRYAQPPLGTYSNDASAMSFPSGIPPASVLPPTSAPPMTQTMPPPPTTQPTPSPYFPGSSPPPSGPPTHPPAQPSAPPTGHPGIMVPGQMYQPVQHHWFYCKHIELRLVWFPFSHVDSARLEDAFNTGKQDGGGSVVRTHGDRYDVQLPERTRHAVYWEEETTHVRRCSWFYKQDGDNRFVPYEEDFADKLEEEFRNTLANNMWHKKLEFAGGETIVMHSPQVIVHFRPTSQPDEWGTTQGEQLRPRVVKRGIDDFESIEEGECSHVDHLVFVVHGIGPVCDLRFRSVVECVDDFRSTSLTLMKTHFKSYLDEGRVGRVEFLPVHWHSALHGDATGIDRRLKAITLGSIAKLRHFTNDTLLDILFYSSPTYSQQIIDTIASEMMRMYELFLSRNQTFNGEVSVAGHSLGSLILFDLLLNQGDMNLGHQHDTAPHQKSPADLLHTEAVSPPHTPVPNSPSTDDTTDMNLADILSRLGISNLLPKFEQEQIDIDTLSMCDETDIKEMGIPMGPRKKLLGFIKERKEKQERTQTSSVIVQNVAASTSSSSTLNGNAEENARYPLLHSDSGTFVTYMVGDSGIGVPSIRYPQLNFEPSNFFAIGSPISMFLTVRGVETLGDEFKFPTCPGFFNIFHPFDPVAYRLEPLINPMFNMKPVQIPHHKGRKRLHLELRDSLSRVGESLRQTIIDSVKNTWSTINDFARAHRTTPEAVSDQVNSVVSEMTTQEDDQLETASTTSSIQEEGQGQYGAVNQGRRIDYVLQEKPIESFNDYLFALGSHTCYWESEDTVLLILKETYALMGVVPERPGKHPPHQPPAHTAPPQGFTPSPVPSLASPARSPQYPSYQHHSPLPSHSPHAAHQMAPHSASPQQPPLAPPTGPVGPPPLQGFVRTGK